MDDAKTVETSQGHAKGREETNMNANRNSSSKDDKQSVQKGTEKVQTEWLDQLQSAKPYGERVGERVSETGK